MRRIIPLILIAFFLVTGCAVLTPSQVVEVEKFAKATTAYSEMPNGVMNAHSELRSDVKVANASGSLTGENAWFILSKTENFAKNLDPLSIRAEKACSVLRNYGDLLSALASDEHTTKLQACAEKLGSSLDSAVSKYNEITGGKIGTFGSAAAAIVRGAGGLYIKRQQTKALKDAVEKAEPVVKEMVIAISELLKMYTDADNDLNLLLSERDALIDWYKTKGFSGPLSTSQKVIDDIKKADSAMELSKKSIAAIEKLGDAHAALVKKVKSKMDLADSIESVKVFVVEVDAAKELYEKLSEK